MRKVFITGGTGFVGTHLINLLSKDNFLVSLDHHLSNSTKKVKYHEGDITNVQTLYDLLNKYQPEVIIHLAAQTKTWFNDAENILKVNISGTLNLYESVIKIKSSKKYHPKILYVSSSEIYGKTTNPTDIDENSTFYPVSFYGVSKCAADRLSYQYSQNQKLNIVILRPFTHTGPGQKKGFFVPDMISQIIDIENTPGKNVLFVGNLDATRDYLDVRDVINAYKLVINNPSIPGEAYNICSGKGVKIKDILNLLLKHSNKKIVVKTDKERFRPIDVPIYIGKNTKFATQYNWKPQFSLDETLQDIVNYWRSN